MRVGERHPDLLAVVLEREDVLDAVDRTELRRPVGPDVDDQPGAVGAEVGEDPACSSVKQTTSQRPKPAATGQRRPGRVGGTSADAVDSDGNRFSKTTTW